MDAIENYRQIIQKVFREYAKMPYAHGDIKKEVIFDRETDSYLLMAFGWDGAKRIHVGSAKLDSAEIEKEIVSLLHCYSMKLYSA